MATDVTILDTRKHPSLLGERRGKTDRTVMFQVAQGIVLFVTLPDETFSESVLEAAIKRELEERGKLVGKVFRVP